MSVQKAQKRGKVNYNWLTGYHYLSFGEYYNPLQINYGPIIGFSHYNLEKVSQFESVSLKNRDVIFLIFKGELRQNNTLQDKVMVQEGNLIQLNVHQKELSFQNQNISDSETLDYIQIYFNNQDIQQLEQQYQEKLNNNNNEQQQQQQQQQQQEQQKQEQANQMQIVNFEQFNEVNVQHKIVKGQNNLYELSLLHIQKDNSVLIECNNLEQNGFYILLKKGAVQIKQQKENGKTFELLEGDVYQSYQGENLEITGQSFRDIEVSNLLIIETQIYKNDLYLYN